MADIYGLLAGIPSFPNYILFMHESDFWFHYSRNKSKPDSFRGIRIRLKHTIPEDNRGFILDIPCSGCVFLLS